MKYLNSQELAEYVKERQAKEARRLKALKAPLALAIVSEGDQPVNQLYMRLKRAYGQDIGVRVEVVATANPTDSQRAVLELNQDDATPAVIVQLPLTEPARTDDVVNLIDPAKDVDGLGQDASYDSAAATAIMWLLAGYNVDLRGKTVAVVGQGRLVGQPLVKLLAASGIEPLALDERTADLAGQLKTADVIISAAGQPGLVTSDMVKPTAVVVDAGTASEDGRIKGDAAPELYEREDITITPLKGGVGPLTVAALFDNVLRAVRAKVGPS